MLTYYFYFTLIVSIDLFESIERLRFVTSLIVIVIAFIALYAFIISLVISMMNVDVIMSVIILFYCTFVVTTLCPRHRGLMDF